ncbi:MAG TPA: MarR family transcriptional regulator [Xanthobacteraceae bacterium]|nr:MarR family transcriptional regulator [Xanthobacteraceae bacterium]
MNTEQAEHGGCGADAGDEAGVWLTITELAERFEVSKATISERVTKFERDGLVKAKPGKGKVKLVNLATYIAAREQVGDPVKEQAAQTKAETAADGDEGRDPRFRDAATKEKEFQAQLAEIRVGKELGRYIEAEFFVPAVEECAEVIARVLDRPLASAAELEAAARSGGVNAVRVALREIIREQRNAISDAMKRLASTPMDQPAPLLDAAEAQELELPLAATEPAPNAERSEVACDSFSGTPPGA